MASALDKFNRADSTTTLGGNWTVAAGGANWGIFSNEAYHPGGTAGSVYYSATTFTGNHRARGVAGAFFSAEFIAPAVRVQSNGDCYTMYAGDLVLVISGSPGVIASYAGSFASGDVIEVGAEGTTITLYKNGVPVASTTDATLSGGQPGMYSDSATVSLNDWAATDIGNGSLTIPIGYWEMEETGTGDDRVDSGPNVNNLDTRGSGGIVNVTTGIIGNAINVSAVDSGFLGVNHNASFGFLDGLTLVAWVNLQDTPSLGIVAGKHDGNTNAGSEFLLYRSSDADHHFTAYSGNSFYDVTVTPTASVWQMLAAQVDIASNKVRLSLNNGAWAETVFSGGTLNITSQPFTIGGFAHYNAYWEGYEDQVGLWPYVLSNAAISFLYNGGAGRSFSELAAFSEPTGNPARIIFRHA